MNAQILLSLDCASCALSTGYAFQRWGFPSSYSKRFSATAQAASRAPGGGMCCEEQGGRVLGRGEPYLTCKVIEFSAGKCRGEQSACVER